MLSKHIIVYAKWLSSIPFDFSIVYPFSTLAGYLIYRWNSTVPSLPRTQNNPANSTPRRSSSEARSAVFGVGASESEDYIP